MHLVPRSVRPQVLGVVGHSGAGKTTLLEQVVPLLRARGLRVGILKHDAHRIELDRKGKDSFRLRDAGADAVVLASDRMVFVSAVAVPERSPEELLDAHLGGLDLDVVLCEGYTHHRFPKIEVLHPERGPRADPVRDGVRAWVHRESVPAPVPPADLPVFRSDQAEPLVAWLASQGLLPASRSLDTARTAAS